jgi:hypothetical protein
MQSVLVRTCRRACCVLHERDFAEVIAVIHRADLFLSAVGCVDPDSERAAGDDVKSVARIAFAKDIAICRAAFRDENIRKGLQRFVVKGLQHGNGLEPGCLHPGLFAVFGNDEAMLLFPKSGIDSAQGKEFVVLAGLATRVSLFSPPGACSSLRLADSRICRG